MLENFAQISEIIKGTMGTFLKVVINKIIASMNKQIQN